MAQTNMEERYKRARGIVETYQKGGIMRARDAMTRQNDDTESLFAFTAHLMSEVDTHNANGGLPQNTQNGKILAFAGKTADADTQAKLDEALEQAMQLDLKLRTAQDELAKLKAAGGETTNASNEVEALKAQIAELEAIVNNGPDGDVYTILKGTRTSLAEAKQARELLSSEFSAFASSAADKDQIIATQVTEIKSLKERINDVQDKLAAAEQALAERPEVAATGPVIDIAQLGAMTISNVAQLFNADASLRATPAQAGTGYDFKAPATTAMPKVEEKAVTGYDDEADDNGRASAADLADDDDKVSEGTYGVTGDEAAQLSQTANTTNDASPSPADEPTPDAVPAPLPEALPAATDAKVEWLNTAGVFKKLGGDAENTESTVTFAGETLTFRQLRQKGPEWFIAHGFEIDARRNANRKPWLRWMPGVSKHLSK